MFENRVFSETDTILKAIKDAKAWKAAQTDVKKPSLPQFVVAPSIISVVNSCTWSLFSDAA